MSFPIYLYYEFKIDNIQEYIINIDKIVEEIDNVEVE